MKSIFDSRGRATAFALILTLLFASCGPSITQRYTDQQGHWVPVFDSATCQIIGNTLAYDSLYKVEPGFSQKLQLAKHEHDVTPAIILCILALGLIGWGIYYSTNAGKEVRLAIVAFLLAIGLFGAAFATIDWAHTKELEIPKVIYDSVQKVPGGLDHYIDENILQ
jgi:hypothetical protein